jgi:hypothetical protein
VGLAAPAEGLTRGPEALALDPEGGLVVLDSVNRRLLRLTPAGVVDGTTAVDLRYPRFLAVDQEYTWVLDIDEDRMLMGYDRAGDRVTAMSLRAPREPVTGLFVHGGRVLVETGHDRVVVLPPEAGADGAPVDLDALPTAPGRPARSGAGLTARLDRGAAPRVEVRRSGAGPVPAGLTLPPSRAIDHLVALDGDARGDLFLGARLTRQPARGGAGGGGQRSGGAGDQAGTAAFLVTRVPHGAQPPFGARTLRARSLLLPESSVAELGEPYVIGPDGTLYQPLAESGGYTIRVHRFPEEGGA